MAVVMIGVDPHKASHTAVAINAAEQPLGQLRVRASAVQAERLLGWAQAWPERAWAVEGAGGLGHLLAQQLLSAGERVLDVPPKLAARVRLLATGDVNKNDPNDARSVAVAALRSAQVREVRRDDHAAVLKVWAKRYRDLGRARTQVACRLHQVLCELIPGGVPGEITAGQAGQILASSHASGGGRGGPLGARRRAHRGPARRRRADPRDPQEGRRRGPGGRDQPDRAVRGRPGHRRRGHRRRPPRVPLPEPGPLRRLQRHRPHRGILRRPQDLPAVPARQPPAQPRDPHGRGHPDPLPAHQGPRLLRQETGRRQNPQRSAARAQTPDQRRHLRLPASRRPARRSRRSQEPGRATGERLCIQGGRRTPRPPALRASHSRACHPPYDPRCSLSRAAAIPCERAAGSRTGRSPAAQRRPQGVLDAAAREPIMPAAGKEGAPAHGSSPPEPLPHRISASPLTLKQRGVRYGRFATPERSPVEVRGSGRSVLSDVAGWRRSITVTAG